MPKCLNEFAPNYGHLALVDDLHLHSFFSLSVTTMLSMFKITFFHYFLNSCLNSKTDHLFERIQIN